MTEGFEQDGGGGYDEDLPDFGGYDDGTQAELADERERREHAEVQALVTRHPELGEEATAARLIGAAAEVAETYGLDPGVVQDPRFLGLVADHYDLADGQQGPQQHRDPFGAEATLEALAPRNNGLPFP